MKTKLIVFLVVLSFFLYSCPTNIEKTEFIISDDDEVTFIDTDKKIHVVIDTEEPKDIFFIYTNYDSAEHRFFYSSRNIKDISNNSVNNISSKNIKINNDIVSESTYNERGIHAVTMKNIENAKKFSPQLKSKSLNSKEVVNTVDYSTIGKVGDKKNFYDYDDDDIKQIGTTLRYISPSAIETNYGQRALRVWVEDAWYDESSSDKLDSKKIKAFANKFLSEETGKDNDIYDYVTNIFGAEWGNISETYPYLINFTGIIDIVLIDIDGDNSTSGGVLGYFYSRDNFKNSDDISYSNERICFVMDAVLLACNDKSSEWDLETNYWPQEMVSTLAHEFQHMISFYQNIGESYATFVTEMLSLCTEDLIASKINALGPRGVKTLDAGSSSNVEGRLPIFDYFCDWSMSSWSSNSSTVVINYAMAYSFGAYLMRQYGGTDILKKIYNANDLGPSAILSAVKSYTGDSNYSFQRIMGEWAAAVLLSDDTSQPVPYRCNTGSGFTCTSNGTTYKLGDINFWNYYCKVNESETFGPWINSGSRHSSYCDENDENTFIYLPYSNNYYLAAENKTNYSVSMTLSDNICLTVVIK